MITGLLLLAAVSAPPKPICLSDTSAVVATAVERIAEIVTRRDGEMAVKRRILSLPFVARSQIRIRSGGADCRMAVEAYRRSLELMSNDPLADLVVLKVGQERYVVVAADRLDAEEHAWAVYDQEWEEQILFKP